MITLTAMIPTDDIAGITTLWHDAFGDEPEFIAEYLHRFVTPDNYIFERDELHHPLAMVHFPLFRSESGLTVAYLYALAVAAEHRGKGVAVKVVNRLFGCCGADVVVTIPFPHSLQSWYASRFGFELASKPVSVLSNLDFDLGSGSPSDDVFMVKVISADNYRRACISLYGIAPQCNDDELYRKFPVSL
ncbi:MAG: GNAT family N-acetyltransferase [Muribaculaceae bacterium]